MIRATRRHPRGTAALLLTMLPLATAGNGCSKSADPAENDPATKMFEASYERFIASARGHAGGCEIALTATGDAGPRNDGLVSRVEIDDKGNYRLTIDDELELVQVGSVTWQRRGNDEFARIESGARADLLRDDAIAGWRDVLRPLRGRLTITPAGTRPFGERKVQAYAISGEPGGGADGGVQLVEATGTVELDAETGFPVTLKFEGAWEGPATPPAEGRVQWSTQKLECGVEALGGVPAITPAVPTPTPDAAPESTPTGESKPKPKSTPRRG